MNKNERSNHAEQPRKRCVDDGSRKEFDQVLEECELVTHRHRHGDCPRGSGGGVSYDNGAKSNTQGRACIKTNVQTTRNSHESGVWMTVRGRSLIRFSRSVSL